MTITTQDKRASSSSPQPGHQQWAKSPIETTEQLRIAIDHGHSRVDATDPAAVPLGTDDEAGGTPNNAAQVSLAAAHEISPPQKRQRTNGLGPAWLVIWVTLFIAVSVVASSRWLQP